jgi:hypothetical protein
MSDVKIKTGHVGFYDEYGTKKVALLEGGQELKIVRELPDNKYICEVVNPTKACKLHGGYHGMTVETYVENLEVI